MTRNIPTQMLNNRLNGVDLVSMKPVLENLVCFKPVLKNLIQLNVINEGDYDFIPIDLSPIESVPLKLSSIESVPLELSTTDAKKPKIRDKDEANSTKRLTRKNLNSNHFNDNLGYRKSMNKVESWLNDYPKSGVLYPYFDLSNEKNC